MRPAHLSPGLVFVRAAWGLQGVQKKRLNNIGVLYHCCLTPPPPQHDLPSSVCTPVEKYDNYKVTEFGSVAGAAKMKAEIYARGDLLLNSQLFHSILSDCYMGAGPT